MTRQDIIKLFPITTLISQEVLDNRESIGFQLLQLALPKELHEDIFWGLSIGSVKGVEIGTYEIVNYKGKKVLVPLYLQRSDIKEPREIKFELRKSL